MQYNNVMIDLETVGRVADGVNPPGAIAAIGAVFFNISPFQMGEHTRIFVNTENAVKKGLYKDPETVAWWEAQSPEVRNYIFKPPLPSRRLPLEQALGELTHAIRTYAKDPEKIKVWSRHIQFDLHILRYAYGLCKLPCPWKYYQEYDQYTIVKMAGLPKPENLQAHEPVADCEAQINHLINSLGLLTPNF